MELIMYKSTLRKVGGSVMLAVSPTILDLLRLHPRATVGLTVDHTRLVVQPLSRPHYNLDELLAQCDASAETSEEDRNWLNNKPIGNELL